MKVQAVDQFSFLELSYSGEDFLLDLLSDKASERETRERDEKQRVRKEAFCVFFKITNSHQLMVPAINSSALCIYDTAALAICDWDS